MSDFWGREACQTLNPEIKLRLREVRAVLGTAGCPNAGVFLRLMPEKRGFQASLRLGKAGICRLLLCSVPIMAYLRLYMRLSRCRSPPHPIAMAKYQHGA